MVYKKIKGEGKFYNHDVTIIFTAAMTWRNIMRVQYRGVVQ